MLRSSKQFSTARTVAHSHQIHKHILGKNEISENFLEMIDNALEANEIVKISLLKTCVLSTSEVADILEKELSGQTIQKIGRTILFYRESRTNKTFTKLINE